MQDLSKPILLILAGGESSRMGTPKGLLPYNNKPWLLEQLRRAEGAGFSQVCIGLGYQHQLYFDKMPVLQSALQSWVPWGNMELRCALNQNPELGPFSTLQTLAMLLLANGMWIKPIVVAPVDRPLPNSLILKQLLDSSSLPVNERPLIKQTAVWRDNVWHPAHPVRLEPMVWNRIISLAPENPQSRLDLLIQTLPSQQRQLIQLHDERLRFNLDTPNDWQVFLEYEAEHPWE